MTHACSSKTFLKCRFFSLVYCALQVNWKRLKLEGRPLPPEGLGTPALCWFQKLNWLTCTRDSYFGSYYISGKLHPKSLLVTNYFNSLCLGTAGGLCIRMQHCTEQPSFSAMQDWKKWRCSPYVSQHENTTWHKSYGKGLGFLKELQQQLF